MSLARYDSGSSGLFSATLKDANNVVIPLANINSLTLTLTDSATGGVINSRNSQNVLNANNVTVNSTTGAVNWTIQAADTTVLDDQLPYAEHVANFLWVYETSKVGTHQHRLHITNFLQLCTVDDIKLYQGRLSDGDIPFVQMLIEQISARAEVECMRKFRKSTTSAPTIQYFSPKETWQHIRLSHYPIDSVVEVVADPNGAFSGSTLYTYQSVDYGTIPHMGLLKLRNQLFAEGERSLRVTYTGGLAREVGSVPMDLRFAAVRQVLFWLNRRTQVGVDTVTVARGGKEVLSKEAPDLLRDVQKVFANYTPVFA